MTYGPARLRYERRKRRRQRQLANSGFWNILTVVFSIATIVLGAWLISFFFIKDTPSGLKINPTTLPDTAEPTLSVNFANTSKQKPDLAISSKPTVEPTAIPEDESNYMFDLQAEKEMISASLFRSDRKCNWLGVAGQVFDLQGRPVTGITVQVSGPLYGNDIRFLSLTGSAPWYGAGGYEIFLSDKPLETNDLFQVRLVDQSGKSLSAGISFNTSSDCNKNLVIINFHQVK